jgi:hypothetical protein
MKVYFQNRFIFRTVTKVHEGLFSEQITEKKMGGAMETFPTECVSSAPPLK